MKEYLDKIYKESRNSYYEYIKELLKKETRKFVITVNPEIISSAKENKQIHKMLTDKNTSLIPDGISIVKACNIYNIPVKERITGVDLMSFLLEEANKQKKSVYFLGAKNEIVTDLVKVVNEKYPNIKVAGFKDGYSKDKDLDFKEIIEVKPDICFVALGVPNQELLIYKHLNKFKEGIFVGVGGSFDVLSGHKKRAPKFFIKTNTEWLYRIICEPNRIKRFWNNNVKFIINVMKEKNKKN